jgi:hypothetical protein
MHDNLQWYRNERARALSALRGVAEPAPQVSTGKNTALEDAARELASALDFVDLQLERLTARAKEG